MKNVKVFAALGVAGALGIACVPMASYAETYNTTANVTVTVDSTASVTWNVDTTATTTIAPGTAATFGNHSVTMANNNNSGFYLKVTGNGLLQNGANSIHAISGKGAIATSASSVTTSAWGVQANTTGGAPAVTDTNWVGPSSTYQTLLSGISGATSSTTAYIYYAAAASSSQPAGDYSGTITLLLDPSA